MCPRISTPRPLCTYPGHKWPKRDSHKSHKSRDYLEMGTKRMGRDKPQGVHRNHLDEKTTLHRSSKHGLVQYMRYNSHTFGWSWYNNTSHCDGTSHHGTLKFDIIKIGTRSTHMLEQIWRKNEVQLKWNWGVTISLDNFFYWDNRERANIDLCFTTILFLFFLIEQPSIEPWLDPIAKWKDTSLRSFHPLYLFNP
jgi:hypothetical protein